MELDKKIETLNEKLNSSILSNAIVNSIYLEITIACLILYNS
jgi:hypothetical protein